MNKIYDLKGKDKGIVVVKFFAALLITWAHMALLFPKYGSLVKGGAIGDAMFFFCSGYTLFLGRDGGIVNWYKRRVSRIYPSVIMWALFSSVAFGWIWNVTDLITTPKYWFLPCIMVYYLVLYMVRRFFLRQIKYVFGGTFLIIIFLGLFVIDMGHSLLYAQLPYFLFMLMGAIVALDSRKENREKTFGRLSRLVNGGVIPTVYINRYFCLQFQSFFIMFAWLHISGCRYIIFS